MLDPDEAPMPGWVEIVGGRIAEVGEGPPREKSDAFGGDDALITPGFIDAHVHLPQFGVIGCDGMPLLEWLDRVVYPAELAWADEGVAQAQAHRALGRMLRAGTLGYAGFLTAHRESLIGTIRAGYEIPLRAIAGQAVMDRGAPDALLRQPIARLAKSARARLDAAATPRFAVTCSDALLADVARRAKQAQPGGAFIQTHLAESDIECAMVRELFPNDAHYAGVYDRHGLLTPRTLLAHCVHLSDDEWKMIADRNSVVVHCPTANTFLQAGLFDMEKAREHGVRLALGSDVAGGPDVAMPRVARAMIEVAKMRRMTIAPDAHVPSPVESWRMITHGNADALGFEDHGRIETGAAADLLILQPDIPIDEYLIGRLIYGWRDDWITHRILNGSLI